VVAACIGKNNNNNNNNKKQEISTEASASVSLILATGLKYLSTRLSQFLFGTSPNAKAIQV